VRGEQAMWALYEKAIQFFRDVRSELRKVTFPTRKETVASTVLVLIAVFAVSMYLGVVDFVLSIVIRGILR
jgi:preprotein translocase subunit SecE